MKKITYFMLMITLILCVVFGLKSNESYAELKDNKNVFIDILVADKIQYEMVLKIVGDKHNVQYVCTSGEDLLNHKGNMYIVDYSPDIIFYSDEENEKWIMDNMSIIDKNNTDLVDIGRGCRKNKDRDIIALYNIKAVIEEKDPSNREYYEEMYKKAVDEKYNEEKI